MNKISHHIWDVKYRYREGDQVIDQSIEDSWRRIAKAVASVETKDREAWEKKFYKILEGFQFLPGGRIWAGAGTTRQATLFNCFVMGPIPDSMEGIFDAVKEGAITMQHGGGVGYDFSTLRPRGTVAKSAGTIASGPVSFMRIWDAMCATLLSTGTRRGAMMATLRCDHPDIIDFVEAKRDRRELRHFNVSVLITDKFMKAVEDDADWSLTFPRGTVVRTIRARDLWDRIMRAAYDCAEPGVLFIDQINRMNNLWYREEISATNPCGEIPLPPYGACNLGSINLAQFVREPFTPKARLDLPAILSVAEVAVRMLDDVTDLSLFPLPAQKDQAQGCRRIGLGVTGLADALMMLGLDYGAPEARKSASEVMEGICQTAYQTSIALAKEKGSFPFLEKESFLEGEFVGTLPQEIREEIEKTGIRNSHLIAIAPAGTISLMANNVSSGIEPIFAFHHRRNVIERDGSFTSHDLVDYAWSLWRKAHRPDDPVPPSFLESHSLAPLAHLEMEAALMPYVDNAISKTVNIPEKFEFNEFRSLYEKAYAMGLKGCTVFRPNPVTGEILSAAKESIEPGCCDTAGPSVV